MERYRQSLQRHLANYAKNRLGVFEPGIYKNKRYSHILPVSLKFLNILEPIRAELQVFLRKNRKINLHHYFHHLNSSQAFAFNLFFPYFVAGGEVARTFSSILGIDSEVLSWLFGNGDEGAGIEKILVRHDGLTVVRALYKVAALNCSERFIMLCDRAQRPTRDYAGN